MKRGNLGPQYIESFPVISRVAYRLDVVEVLSTIHKTIHVSQLHKCLVDDSVGVPLDDI